MKVSVNKYGVKILTPDEGCFLTQKHKEDWEEHIFSLEIILAKDDSEDNYEDISISESDAIVAQWRAEQELKMQQEMNNL